MARTSGLASASRVIADRYRVEALLGQGGMGAVYAAVDTTSGKRLAIKTTRHTESAKVLELFKREFHTLHGLRHPNIIEVYDYGSDSNGPFYTMELLEGGDLGRAAPLPWRQVCNYVRQVATLLGLLHARRLLHRDVTPRNLWVLPDGRLKLIDFGALCPFGVPTEVVGTPPFIAPEWLFDRALAVRVDQRADLYALGALAYWLLTSVHAYPARTMNDLPRAWSREPARPSSLAKLVENRALEPIPEELDGLILSLLRSDPEARPPTTELLIDRIDAIAGPTHESTDHAVRGYVRSKVFVGRDTERKLIAGSLKRGEGCAIAVEAVPGMGRTRLLEELSLLGRLSGATTVLVRGDEQASAYSVANRIALGLLDGSQGDAATAAGPHAYVLAQLSGDVQRRFGVSGPIARDETRNGRALLQQALTEWVFAVAASRRVLLLVDDLEHCDEESATWLAALALQSNQHLLLVAALVAEPSLTPALHLQIFRNAAQRLTLAPLTATEIHQLLESVFGGAAYLARVAESLHRVSQGSPAHCLELVEHLVEHGLARYSEGTWTLPGQLSDAELPRNRTQMHLARLEQLDEAAQRLAELLSVHEGRLSRSDCQALSDASEADTDAAIVELTLRGVLMESDEGYNFAHASVRESLLGRLAPDRRRWAHARLGESLLAGAKDPIDGLRAGLHLYRSGDAERCEQLVSAAALHLLENHRARMQVALPMLEQAVELYRAAGCGPEILATPLAALAAASFFVDRRLADRYGVAAIEALERVLRFDLARSLHPVLGRKLAFYVSLTAASLAHRRGRSRSPSVAQTLRMFVGCVVAMNAVATSGVDLDMTARCKRAFEPLAGLGDRNIAGFVRRCTLAVAAILTEDHAGALAELKALRDLMDSGARIRRLPDHLRLEFLGGCMFSIGIMECWRQSPVALEIADRIESFSPMYAMNADQLRTMYFSGRGNLGLTEFYRQRVETRALQVGASWQVVTLGPIDAHLTALWTHDALLAKRAAAELERLSREIPSMRHEAQRARATYLVLTGRFREAVDTMNGANTNPMLAGWSRGQGVLARAHNRLGEHARARELCQVAIAGRSEENLSFVVMNLHVQLELALADAALGDFNAARERSDRLLARQAQVGPIALGAIHETRARVALLERDFQTCRKHCEAMRHCYVATANASLRELSERIFEKLAVAERGETRDAASPAVLLDDDGHLMTRMRLILTHTEATFERRAQRGLQLALELTGAEDGFVLSGAAEGGLVGLGDRAPASELVSWAQSQLGASDLEQTAVAVPGQTLSETSLRTFDEVQYCVMPLGPVANGEGFAAGLVLGFREITPRAPNAEVLAMIAGHLLETQAGP